MVLSYREYVLPVALLGPSEDKCASLVVAELVAGHRFHAGRLPHGSSQPRLEAGGIHLILEAFLRHGWSPTLLVVEETEAQRKLRIWLSVVSVQDSWISQLPLAVCRTGEKGDESICLPGSWGRACAGGSVGLW